MADLCKRPIRRHEACQYGRDELCRLDNALGCHPPSSARRMQRNRDGSSIVSFTDRFVLDQIEIQFHHACAKHVLEEQPLARRAMARAITAAQSTIQSGPPETIRRSHHGK